MQALNRHVHPDVILLVRGGGSIEDLAAFNDEGVARAIVASQAPVVSGVGHETDFTIADFVADRRAPTPSAAAEIVTPDVSVLSEELRLARARLADALAERLRTHRWELDEHRFKLRLASPRAQVAGARQRLDDLGARAQAAIGAGVRLRRAAVGGMAQTLRAVGPSAVLERGYAVVRLKDGGQVVRSRKQAPPGATLEVRVADGVFPARAE
jgi:exodeoxyribonuclease VII large subunit